MKINHYKNKSVNDRNTHNQSAITNHYTDNSQINNNGNNSNSNSGMLIQSYEKQ